MEFTLQDIDNVRSRTGVSYEEAYRYLRETDGNVLEAILMIERAGRSEQSAHGQTTGEPLGGAGKAFGSSEMMDEMMERGRYVVDRLRKVIRDSSDKKIVVKRSDKKVMEMPLLAGVVGAVLAPQLAVAGAFTALLTRCTLDVEDRPGDHH